MTIPKIIHQLWKDEAVPERYRPLVESWKHWHPEWEYRLWTDEDIRRLVADRYPDFLPVFDGYKDNICRADAGRYLILREYGGVYADLDEECLRPLDELLKDSEQLVIGCEPADHLLDEKVVTRRLGRLLCPTVIASPPRHKFWDHVLVGLKAAHREVDPLDATGPFLLTRAYEAFADKAAINLLPFEIFYPFTKSQCWNSQLFNIAFWEQATRNAYGVHYWDGSWFRNAGRPLAPFPTKFGAAVEKASAPMPSLAPRGDELISCLMLLYPHMGFANLLIDSFCAQTYGNLELVIIDQTEGRAFADAIEARNDPRIRVIQPPEKNAWPNQQRDFALSQARGAFACFWNEDELNDPRRLEAQITAMVRAKVPVCLVKGAVNWIPSQNRLGVNPENHWESSLLCATSIFPRYLGQDFPNYVAHLAHVRATYGATYIEMPRLQIRILSERNIAQPERFQRTWQQSPMRYEGERARAMIRELDKRIPLLRYQQCLSLEKDYKPSGLAGFRKNRRPFGINLFGHFGANLGISTSARGVIAALEQAGIACNAIDLDRLYDPALRGEDMDFDKIAPYAINIFNTGPGLLPLIMQRGGAGRFDARLFTDRYDIGYWAWESPTSFPDDWRIWTTRFDEIWTCSAFTTQCLVPYVPLPIIDLPHNIETQSSSLTRSDLGLPEGRFLFLFIFDELSTLERKNPLGLIEAYNRAFPEERDDVGLIIKVRELSAANLQLLQEAARGRPSIEFRVGDVARDVVTGLIQQCDAYVSLHRAEGFGLTMAEAMAQSKPVIATNYSGNLEFMKPDNSYLVSFALTRLQNAINDFPAGTEWAEPDLNHAATLMRYVANNREAAKKTGRRGARYISEHFNTGVFARRIRARLDRLMQTPTPLPPETRGGKTPAGSVLILSPVKNVARYLPRYFQLLENLDYDPARMSIGFLEGDSTDTTFSDLEARLPQLREAFRNAYLIKQDHGFQLQGERWHKNQQRMRREVLAKARNQLLSATLKDEDWVLWLDADLVDYPPDLLKRLIASEKEIVVPCCLRPSGLDFDLNSFRFDPAKGPLEDPAYLLDEIYQPPRGWGRSYISELTESPARIDSVGGTALLIRAELHREGLEFPAYSYRGYIETEGLAMLAKDMGHECWALPDLRIVHSAH